MTKKAAELLLEAGVVVPGNGAPVLRNQALAIAEGRILAIGDAGTLEREYEPQQHLRLPHHLLLPGLINAHGHLAMSLLRGYAEDLPLKAWLEQRIWPAEAKFVDSTFVRDGTRLAMLEMLRAGITCFSDMYFFPDIVAREARAGGMRAQIAFPVIDFANAWSGNADEAIHKGLTLADEYRHDDRLRIAFGPHSVTTVAAAALDKVAMFAEELDLCVQIHLHENAAEVAENVAALGASGIQHLNARGLLGPGLQAVHVTQISVEDMELLSANNVHVVHCPTSNARLACGSAPVPALRQAGINVCLGTDGAASSNRQSVLAEARLAVMLARLSSQDAATMPAAQALDMATINGARALGMDTETGSLEVGKAADIIAIDGRAPELQPLYDPLAQLIHGAADTRVSHVWVAGQCLLDDGRATRFDEAEILARTDYWREQIAAWT